jgi:hypothetical protein
MSEKIEKVKSYDDSSNSGSGPVEISGNLYKRRGGFGKHMPNAWQLRRFSMKDGIMVYFDGDDKQPRGKIDLKSENCIMQHGIFLEGAPTAYTLQLSPGGWDEKWKLCADSNEDLTAWVTLIEKHISENVKRPDPLNNLKEYVCSDDEDDYVKPSSSTQQSTTETPRKDSGTIENSQSSSSVPSPAAKSTPSTKPPSDTSTTRAHSSSSAATAVAKKGGGRKLKLNAGHAAESDQEELLMTVIIYNMCIVFSYFGQNVYNTIFLIIVANYVIIQTLYLRSNRKSNTDQPRDDIHSSTSARHASHSNSISSAPHKTPVDSVSDNSGSSKVVAKSTESNKSETVVGSNGEVLTPMGKFETSCIMLVPY